MASNPPRPPTLDELLADIRGGFGPRPDREYPTELPERFRKPRPPKPPAPPTVEERGMLDEALARVRGTFSAEGPDVFGTYYKPPPPPPEVVEPGRIQKDIEDQIRVGAEQVSRTGGNVEEYVSRMHALKYGKRIAGLLKAGRDHATKLAREGTSPDEAETAGIELAQRHITNLENSIAAGEQAAEAEEAGPAYQGLIEGFTTRKGLARHALTTGLPMVAAGIAMGPLGWGTLAGMAVAAATTTAGVAAAQKFVDDQENVDWKTATTEGITNIIPVSVLGATVRGAISRIPNPLARRAVGALAVSAAEAIEEPTQAVASALVRGQPIPSAYSLAAEAAAGGILGGAIGGGAAAIEQVRQQTSDDTAGATEIEAAPPTRSVGRMAQEAADDQLAAIEQALGGARFAGDLNAMTSLEEARQEILDARAKGSEAAVSPDPPPPGQAGPVTAPPAPPPAAPPAPAGAVAPTLAPAAGPPPGPVGGTSIRPQVPTETAAGAAGETTVAEEARARQAGIAPQVRSLTERGRAEGQGEPAPPTPPVVRGPTGGTARGVETTPTIAPAVPTAAPAGRPGPPAAPGLAAAPPSPPMAPGPPPAPPIPPRRLKIGRGANGQVDVVFPDKSHADLFSLPGRVRRAAQGVVGAVPPDAQGVSSSLGIPPDLLGQAATRYRDAVMEAIRSLPAGEVFVAPSLQDVFGRPAPTGPPVAPAPAVPSAGPSRIILEPRGDTWVAHHEGPIADEVMGLFGQVDVPTPFFTSAPPEQVVAEIQRLNPDVEVSVRGTVPSAPAPTPPRAAPTAAPPAPPGPSMELPPEVVAFAREEQGAGRPITTGQLQRRFRVGFGQAQRWGDALVPLLHPLPPREPAPPPAPPIAHIFGTVVPEPSLLARLSETFRKPIEAALGRAPEAIRPGALAGVEAQIERLDIVGRAQDEWEYFGREFDSIGQRIKNRAAKRRAAKDALESAKGIYESGWESMVGTLRDVPEGQAIARRLRQLVEGKGVRLPGEVERPPITTRAYTGVKGFVDHHPNAPTLEEAIAKVKEYATAHPRAVEDVLSSLQRVAGEVGSMGAAALRQVVDIPGFGPAKVQTALAKASGADFDKIVAYRREAEAEERAMEEFFSEFDDTEFAHPDLRSIADALEEDEASGLADPDEPPLLKTFMWGVVDPGTGEQVGQDAAVEAIRQGHGRLFSRIRTAYQDAMAAVEDNVPFDIPEGGAADDEILEAKRDFAFVSSTQDPFNGRYGPPPKKLTPEQIEARKKWIAKRLGGESVQLPAQRPAGPAVEPEGEAAPAVLGPAPGGEGPVVGARAARGGGRGGRRPGVPVGVPGAAGAPGAPAAALARVGPPAAPRAGIFYIVNPREAETLKRPPRYDLIPVRLNQHLSDDQRLGVAKAIEALQAGSGFLFQDGTGVGKTRELLALAEKFRLAGNKVLIVSKASAIEATKLPTGKWVPSGSYADDSEAMDIPITFTRDRAVPLKAGVITLGTYNRLRDYAVDKDTVLLFDEAHMLKNIGDSEVAASGIDLMRKAKVTGFATATPGDKAYHLGYLAQIGLLEGKSYEQAMRDLGLQAKPRTRISKKVYDSVLKAELAKRTAPEEAKRVAIEAATEEFMVWKATSPTKHRRAVEGLFNRLTESGTVIKREVDLSPVEVQTVLVPLDEEGHQAMQTIEEGKFDRKNALMHMRRQQEPYKLARVQQLIQQELGLGRQVVVFATRIHRSEVVERARDPRTGELIERTLLTSEGTLKSLGDWLDAEGISYSEIHGEAKESSKDAQARFQSGNAKVVIATYEKGGTGINLDDRSGAAPRTMILMTAPFDSVSIVQAIGRVHRFTTRTPSKILMLYSDHGIDKWNAAVMGGKLKQLHAQVSGDINALDLGNTSADEDALSAGAAHYMDVGAVLQHQAPAGVEVPIYSPRHYGKIVRQLKQMGVKITLTGGDFEIAAHEGFTVTGSITKTPDARAYATFRWDHDEEAGDLRLAEALKPRPVAREPTATVHRELDQLQRTPLARKPIVSQKQYDFLHRTLTRLGASWGVTELPGAWQIQTAEGDFFTGELTPHREGARLVFGKVVDRPDMGAFYWQRLAGEVRLEAPLRAELGPPARAEARLAAVEKALDRAYRRGRTQTAENLEAEADELRTYLEGAEAAVDELEAEAEPGITAALDRFSQRDVESDDQAFEGVGQITGVVGRSTARVRIPTYARPELPWGAPVRLGQGTLLTPGAELGEGVVVAATQIREGFERIGRIDWNGIVVRTLADAGAVFHTARNPSLEHAVMFFVDIYGVIVGSMQATSNSPNFVSWGRDFFGEVRAKLDGFKAQGIEIKQVFDLHNHPSSDPTPSATDRKHFRNLARELGTLYGGSAVIDHETIALWTASGKRYNIRKRGGGFLDPDPFLAEGVDTAAYYAGGLDRIVDDTSLRAFSESLLDEGLWKPGSTSVSVAFLDNERKTRLVTLVPEAVFTNRGKWTQFAARGGRIASATSVVAATDGGFSRSPALQTAAVNYIHEGSLQEMIDLQTKDATAGLLRGGGIPIPSYFNWRDNYPATSEHVRLESTLQAIEPARSAYPAWGQRAPAWWSRRVDYARARTLARGRGAQANVGVDPQAFWDAFVLGVDAVRRGIRKFVDWIASLAKDIPNFRSWGKRVWDYMVSIGAPVVVEERGRVRPFDEAVRGVELPESRILQPIRQVPRASVNDLVAATEAMLSTAAAEPGAGKPLGIGVPGDLAININNIADENDIRATMTRIVRALEKRFDLARQKFTTAELKDLALALGYDEADYLRMLRVKGALTAPEIIAGRILRQHAGVDFGNKWAAWRDADARANEKNLSPEEQRKRGLEALEAEREKQASLQKLIGMMFGTAAAGSEAGRALYAHKLLISTLTPEEQFLQRLLRAGRADVNQMAALADALARGDHAAVARLIRKIHKPGLVRMLVEYFINSLLSGPPTFVANVTGNVVHELMRTGERGFAARLEQLGIRQGVERLLTGEAKPTDRVVGEAMAALRAQVRHKFGILAALDMARQAIAKEDLRFLQAVKGESYVPAIPGLFGRIVRTPGRVMEALDIGSKINAMAAERAALLWRRAYVETGKAGIGSAEFNERLAELHSLMDEWVALEEQRIADPTTFQRDHGAAGYTFLYRNRDLADIYRQMKHAADVSTFRDETTRFTNFVKQVRGAYPWLTFVVPFVHTTERILVQGFRRTPLGLLKTAYNIQQGKLEGGEASDRLAQGIIGTMTTAAIYMLATDGLLTGGGPEEPKERENWLKTGKLPYALRIGDRWVSYARIEPFATIFGFAADLAEAKDEKTAGDAFGKLHYAVLNNITNKTYLEGIVSAAEAVGNPDRYMARFWKRSAGALVPNLLATAARAIDPTIRETDDLSQVLMSRVPVLSEKLPARLTGTGEARVRGETGISRFVSPVRYSDEAGPERNLERLFLETGYSPSQPPRDITLPGMMGRKVTLNRAERDIYGAYARRATAFARTLAQRGDWTRVDIYAKQEILERIFRFSRDSARRDVLASVLGRLRRGETEVKPR